MKIRNSDRIKSSEIKKSKKSKSSSGADFAKHLESTSDSKETSGTSAVQQADALISLQEVGGGNEEKRRARLQGETILDQLEEIRLNLLTGAIPPQRLERLAEVIQRQKAVFKDPKLKEILLEIELRAKVELAKYQS